MGATPQIPQLAVDLGIVRSDTLVWDPSGLDIFVNLPTDALEIVQASSSCGQACLQFIVHSGDGCQEAADIRSEPTTSPDSGRRSFSGSDVERLTCSAREGNNECENNVNVSSGGTSFTIPGATANVLAEAVETDYDGYLGSNCTSKEKGQRSYGEDDRSMRLSASAEFGIGGLDEDDILAACQLLMLGGEDPSEFEVVDEKLAACRLLELSACLRTDEEEELDKFWYDFRSRASVKLSARVNPSGTGQPYYKAGTPCADKNLDQENDQWCGLNTGRHGSSDLRTFKLKRIKPNKGQSHGVCETDGDRDIQRRPPHKRQYKSLHKMYCS